MKITYSDSKNVLMISQFYPPVISPASRRVGCLAKYLPEFGWRPLVLCQQWVPALYAYDPEYVPGIPSQVLVETVPVSVPSRWSRTYLVDVLRRGFLPHTVPGPFLKGGKMALERLFRRFRIDVIWASYPPASTQVLADWASRRWGVPWVADFRDIVNQYFNGPRAAAVVPIRLLQDRRVLRSASWVVTASEGLAEVMSKRHRRSISVITNGFDPDDMTPPESTPVGRFNIVYTGDAVLGSPDFRPLLDGLKECIDSGAISPEQVSLEFYGDKNESRLQKHFRGHPCEQLVKIKRSVPWRECRQIQRSAAILLQQAFPGKRGIYTSKIFEYLAARRPILAIPADGGCVQELIERTGTGFSCSSAGEIAVRLAGWYREWRETGTIACRGRLDLIGQYSRQKQAETLAGILEAAVLDIQGRNRERGAS